MSIITAVRDGKRVCMACDSQGTNDGSIITLQGSKIVRRGKFLFGACDGNTMQTIKHLIELNPEDWDPEIDSLEAFEWWVHGRFLPALRKIQGVDKVLPTVHDSVQETRAQIMIAHGPRFVCVDTVGFVICPEAPYHAIGSAWCEARGAMWGSLCSDAGFTARLGVQAACYLDNGCSPPIRSEWTEP